MKCFESDRAEVHHATANALAITLATCVDAAMVAQVRVN